MKKTQKFAPFSVACLLLLMLAGCSSSPNVNYYTLSTPINASQSAKAADIVVPALAFNLVSVSVPEQFMRAHIVWQRFANINDAGAAKLEINDLNRWASSFDNEMRDALRNQIRQQIPALDFSQTPDLLTTNATLPLLQISVQLNQLETIENSHIHANFGWKIKSYKNKTAIFCQWDYAESMGAGIPNLVLATQIMAAAAAQNLANDMRQFQTGKTSLLSHCQPY